MGRPDADLPLFGLPRLRAANPKTTLVVVVEGEKCACALQEACDNASLHHVIVVTSVGGAKAARCSDWSVMAGRRVLVLPDNDEAGLGYARDVVELCQQAGASEVAVYELRQHATQLPEKGDIADVLADPNFCGLPLGEGASVVELVDWFQQHAEAADAWLNRYADQNGQADSAAEAHRGGGGRRSQVTKAIELALAESVLFTCQRTGEPFAEVNRGDHKETYPLESGGFTEWLAFRYYQTYGVGLREATAKDACATLRQCAMLNGTKRPVFLRFGYWEGAVYWDLGDPQWRCIRITADGWIVVAHADTPIRFRRTDKMTALPDPERGGTLDELRELLNVPDDQWTVLLASIVCNFLPTGTIPILALTGPEGSGKSSVAIRLRQLIDPCTAPTRAGFVDERDLLACVRNNAVIVLDNVSRLSRMEADMICRLASGAGIECRELYTSSKVALIGERRPIVITSITDVASSYADLRDRCFTVPLPPISRRLSEADLEKRFRELHPRLVGAIADRVAAALRELTNVKLDTDHRLLDAIHWAVAAEQGMGEGQLLLGAIENTKRDRLLETVEASRLGLALLRYIVPDPKGWEGTAQELLAELQRRIDADNELNETQRKS